MKLELFATTVSCTDANMNRARFGYSRLILGSAFYYHAYLGKFTLNLTERSRDREPQEIVFNDNESELGISSVS